MRKPIGVALLIVLSCNRPVSANFFYGVTLCPLSRFNISVAEDLLESIQQHLKEMTFPVTSEIQEAIIEAEELLEKARLAYRGQNCITSNFLAIRAQNLLKEAKNNLESLMDEKEEALRREEYVVYFVVIERYLNFWDRGFYYDGTNLLGGPLQCIVIENHTYFYISLNTSPASAFTTHKYLQSQRILYVQ